MFSGSVIEALLTNVSWMLTQKWLLRHKFSEAKSSTKHNNAIIDRCWRRQPMSCEKWIKHVIEERKVNQDKCALKCHCGSNRLSYLRQLRVTTNTRQWTKVNRHRRLIILFNEFDSKHGSPRPRFRMNGSGFESQSCHFISRLQFIRQLLLFYSFYCF